MTMKKLSKRVRVTAAVLTVAAVGVGACSYFTDYEIRRYNAAAGTVDIRMTDETQDLTDGLTIMNPGDSNDLSFTVSNAGEKSADVKAVITVTPDSAMDADNPFKVTDNDGTELQGTISEEDLYSTVYELDDIVLDGSIEHDSGQAEKQLNHIYDYQFVMDGSAPNECQGANVDVTVEVYAKQHRNTDQLGDTWTSIVEKKQQE